MINRFLKIKLFKMFKDSPLIKSKYKIQKQLGEGSYGRVYLASTFDDKVNKYSNNYSL